MNNSQIALSEHDNIINLYKSGLSQSKIGDMYGTSREPIKRILKLYCITRNDKPNRFSMDDMDKIITMYNNGLSTKEIGKLYNTTDETIRCWLDKSGIDRRHSLYTLNEHYFDKIDNQDKAYILGLLYADGYYNQKTNTVSITLQEDDKHILEEINNLINSDRHLRFVNNNQYKETWKNCYQLVMTGKHISSMLCNYGVLPKKSLILEYPYWLDKSLQRHFVRGYFDGDGHIAKAKYKYNMSIIGTDNFCDGVKKLIEEELQLCPRLYVSQSLDKPTRTLMLTRKNDCKMFFDWIYQDANLFLRRKYNVYLEKYCDNDLIINNNLDDLTHQPRNDTEKTLSHLD